MTAGLTTVREAFDFALARFEKTKLVFGHGAANAVDEAAFIVLEALGLPIDDINPWLGRRLDPAEAERISRIVAARIETRKPAAYLLNKAYVAGVPLYVDERVIVPRSYICEIVAGDLFPLAADPERVFSILDLCTGSGAIAIIAAFSFPNARIDAVDLSSDALEVARANVATQGLETRIALHEGDLFAPLAGKRYDLILTNPPYVDARAMAALPAEYRAEPELALAGGADGLDLARRILVAAPAHLNEDGGLLCEIGRGREGLERQFPKLPFTWVDTEESEGEVFWLSAEDFEGR